MAWTVANSPRHLSLSAHLPPILALPPLPSAHVAVNSELETHTPDLLEFGIRLSQDLAVTLKRPGPLPNTISQRDVPGTTRAIIPHMQRSGVLAMSIGVNFGSAPVVLPTISLWRDTPSNTSIYLLYHGRGYGGIATIADFATAEGFPHALAMDWRGDNSGPPAAQELIGDFDNIQKLWPGRKLVMSTFETFVDLLHAATKEQKEGGTTVHRHVGRRAVRAQQVVTLPEYTDEMGEPPAAFSASHCSSPMLLSRSRLGMCVSLCGR